MQKTVEFLRRINGCNNNLGEDYLKESINWVIETNDPYMICDFIENVKACHTKEYIKIFEDAIISIGDIVHIYEFMFLLADLGVKDFDLKRFKEDINSLQEAEIEIVDDEPLHAYEFASSVETENKDAIIDKVIKNKHPKFLHYCLEYVPNLSEEAEGKLKKSLNRVQHPRYKISDDKLI